MSDCVFCNRTDFIIENNLAMAFYDAFPVSPGHVLIVTKRHCPTMNEVTDEEFAAVMELVFIIQRTLQKILNPDGFTIGINCGETAGQTVMHFHVHVIPRRKGDVENPRGGIRGVIPSKKDY